MKTITNGTENIGTMYQCRRICFRGIGTSMYPSGTTARVGAVSAGFGASAEVCAPGVRCGSEWLSTTRARLLSRGSDDAEVRSRVRASGLIVAKLGLAKVLVCLILTLCECTFLIVSKDNRNFCYVKHILLGDVPRTKYVATLKFAHSFRRRLISATMRRW